MKFLMVILLICTQSIHCMESTLNKNNNKLPDYRENVETRKNAVTEDERYALFVACEWARKRYSVEPREISIESNFPEISVPIYQGKARWELGGGLEALETKPQFQSADPKKIESFRKQK